MSELTGISNQPDLPRGKQIMAGKPLDVKLWRAVGKFEEIFMAQFVRTMRTTELKGGLIEESAGHETYNTMLSEAIGREMANRDTILQRQIYRQMGGKFALPPADAAKSDDAGAATAKPNKNPAEKNDGP